MVIKTTTLAPVRFAFLQHTQRMRKTAIPATILLCASCLCIGLAFANALPAGLGPVVALAFVLAVICFIMLVPLVLFFYSYSKGGLWLDDQGIRVKFPAENEQRMDWSEALYAIDEGDEYLLASRGKEGLGHLVGRTHYLRLHLEGMTVVQRAEIARLMAEYVTIRLPQMFTFVTLLNTKGEIVTRGRLYLFDKEVLCAENRGEKRVFIAAPLRHLSWVRRHSPFLIGRLECEAFELSYDKKEYVVMLGYETTLRGALGTSSSWATTGTAHEWIEALQSGG
jgi:hypothetical protein